MDLVATARIINRVIYWIESGKLRWGTIIAKIVLICSDRAEKPVIFIELRTSGRANFVGLHD